MAQSPVRAATHTATGGKNITVGTPFDSCRAVSCGTAGLSVVDWADGSQSNYYFVLGPNPVQITNVVSGAAANLSALY